MLKYLHIYSLEFYEQFKNLFCLSQSNGYIIRLKKKEKSSAHLAQFFFGSNTKQDTITEPYYSGKQPFVPCYSPTTPVHRE